MNSPAKIFLLKLSKAEDPHRILDEILNQLSPLEQAAVLSDWEEWWARPEQLPPETRWQSWGGCAARGWGKTRTFAETVNSEVRAGRARGVALMAQDEDACVNVMIEGPSGLIATAHPSCKAVYEKGQVYWENGATATVFTPKNPEAIFGDEFDLAWISEIHAWPRVTMIEAYKRIRMCVRVGRARLLWDTNPRRKHPIIKALIERGELNPDKHAVFRGTTYDNLENLNPDVVAEWVADYAGTQTGREMLLGEMIDEDDGALFKQEWIDRSRRELPDKFKRKILILDPAISTRKATDATGIVIEGLGADDQIYVIADKSGKLSWEKWGDVAIDCYFEHKLDCVIVERNRGGDACLANIRARAESRGYSVVKVADDAVTRHVPGTIYVKEVIGRISKESRSEPVASLFERGRISMAINEDFEDLEDQMTTFVEGPGVQSPNNLDAFVWGVWELAGLAKDKKSGKSFDGIDTANRVLSIFKQGELARLLALAANGRRI